MKCYNCGDTLLEKMGALQIPSDTLNSYLVENVNYFLCPSCEEILLTDEAWEKAEQIESEQITKIIGSMPITDFVGASNAALLLGMSRQAIHKHRRIKRGFIYSVTVEGKVFYHRESLMLFKDTGDGRFNLARKTSSPKKEYVLMTSPKPLPPNRFTEHVDREEISSTWKKPPHIAKGMRYAYNN